MDLDEFSRAVVQSLEAARDVLAHIEEEARRRDRPELHDASRLYAQYCIVAREYLSGLQIGRPLPRRFAERAGALAAQLVVHEALVNDFQVDLTPQALRQLADEARNVAV